MWTVNYIFSQVFVIVGIALYALTFLLKTKKSVLIVGLIGVMLNTVSFVLLGAYTGALVNVVAMVRSIWFFCEEKRGKRSWVSLVTVMVLIVIATIFTYRSIIDLLPLVAGLAYAFACWQKNIKLYRWSGILVSIIYIGYNIFFNSIFGVVSESIALNCAAIGLILLHIKKKSNDTTNAVPVE